MNWINIRTLTTAFIMSVSLATFAQSKDFSNDGIAGKYDVTSDVDEKTPENTSDDNPWVFVEEIGLGFLKGGPSNYSYEASVGFAYRFPYNLYGSARIGYNSSNYSGSDGSTSVEVRYHLLQIPLEAGYMLQTSNKLWGIVPFAGITTNIGLTGKAKSKSGRDSESGKIKIGGKIGLDARVGLRLRIYGFNISGSYHFPLNEKQEAFFGEDSYPEVSIAYGF